MILGNLDGPKWNGNSIIWDIYGFLFLLKYSVKIYGFLFFCWNLWNSSFNITSNILRPTIKFNILHIFSIFTKIAIKIFLNFLIKLCNGIYVLLHVHVNFIPAIFHIFMFQYFIFMFFHKNNFDSENIGGKYFWFLFSM